MGTDCQSAICTNQICQAPTCVDLSLNGDETDLNCGGSCPQCEQGAHCVVAADCSTGTCTAGICESDKCPEGVLKIDCPLLVDNTPYAFSPGHALTKCIDDEQESVEEGSRMTLFGCKDELHQTFWAVEQGDGYFALRNALSGKCLQVKAASTAVGATVEQSACDYADEQLWKPSLVDSMLMQLTAKHSGLLLDVAGDDIGESFQPVVQGDDTTSADTHWRAVKVSVAAHASLSPYSEQSRHISHDSSATTISEDETPSAQWKVVPGLSNPALVSFQSRNDPGRYLRHAQFRLWTDSNDGSNQFKRDATFRFVAPFVGSSRALKAVEASNYAGHYWRRNGSVIALTAFADTPEYRDAATWWIDER